MSIKKTMPRGNYGVLLTPFSQDGNINEEALYKEIRYCLNDDIVGILVGGSTGEFVYMSPAQRKRIYFLAANQLANKKVLVGGASAPTEYAALDYIYYLHETGYEYSIICPPYYYPQRADDIVEFYTFIASKSPREMKIILYNIPSCAPGISLSILKDLILIENIVGLKDSSGDLIYLTKALNFANEIRPEFSIFVGQDIALLPSLLIGAQGCMSALAWILHRPLNEIILAYDKNDIRRAETLQNALNSIMVFADKIPFPENYRALAIAAGIYCGEPQRAFPELKPDKLNDFINQLKDKINNLNNML